jgi:hypothetical protein
MRDFCRNLYRAFADPGTVHSECGAIMALAGGFRPGGVALADAAQYLERGRSGRTREVDARVQTGITRFLGEAAELWGPLTAARVLVCAPGVLVSLIWQRQMFERVAAAVGA